LDGCTRQAKRAELGIPEDAPVVGCVCVLTEQKGLSHFLDAARAIHDLRPDVRFLIVGGGPLEQSLRNKANEFGLGSAVHFTGWRFDVAELLCALDVFVMSSLWEAMPVALLEAMAARLPIVVTNVGQNACIVEDGVSGVIIEPADASLISSAVLKLLQRPADAARLAEAALGRVHQHFSTDRMIERYESLYAKGVQSRRPGLFSARLSLGSDAITGTASRQDRG
jgi:glycosyltransferase involved in cell wall biosynthesis